MHKFDFLGQPDVENKRGVMVVKPTFKPSRRIKDLVVRGGKFVAAYDEESKLFVRDQMYICELIDDITDEYCKEKFNGMPYKALHVTDPSTKLFDDFEKMCKMLRSLGPDLDRHVIFANDKVRKEDGASFVLPYAIEDIPTPNYDYVMDIWYSPLERQKIEWAIGAVISGESRTKQVDHFIVMYGKPKTGKGSVISIIQSLFSDGQGNSYTEEMKLASLASGSQFAMQSLRNNPLIAIDSDADLSKKHAKAINILNTITSHEKVRMELKGRDDYEMQCESFIFAATNYEVEISGEMSGLNRRLIDVYPTGTIVKKDEYNRRLDAIRNFELGGIAYKCLHLYLNNKRLYDGYTPNTMREKTDWFNDFIHDYEDDLASPNGIYIGQVYSLYKKWCEDKGFKYICNQKELENQLDPYFETHRAKGPSDENGKRANGYFKGFRYPSLTNYVDDTKDVPWLDLKDHGKEQSSLDRYCQDCPAQYGDDHPLRSWENCTDVLSNLIPRKIHWVKVPENLVVIDFDIKDENGDKSFKLNKEKVIEQCWPETYAEVSKSGNGIHLHYIYNGDVSELARKYSDDVEIKVYTGKSSLRRKLSLWNLLDISTLSEGQLPKREKKVKQDTVDVKKLQSEKSLRTLIIRHLNKEIVDSTSQSISLIKDILDKAYESGMTYDVRDMRNDIFEFASRSTNQAQKCMKIVREMKFASADAKEEPKATETEVLEDEEDRRPITFFDFEVTPNKNLLCYKHLGPDKPCVELWNPSPREIQEIFDNCRMVGHNCRGYDNHIAYAIMLGETPKEIFARSNRLCSKDKNISNEAKFMQAYGLSHVDTLEMGGMAGERFTSLKEWEVNLDINHSEFEIGFDKELNAEECKLLAEYCCNDVRATEAVFLALHAEYQSKKILATIATSLGCPARVNDRTNSLTEKIILRGAKIDPKRDFNWRDLSKPCDDKPYFEGYVFNNGVSSYMDVPEIGEGGYVYSNPGMHYNVVCYDVAGMHPSSIIAENLFGEYTKNFKELVDIRVALKHKEIDKVKGMMNGALTPFLTDAASAKQLSSALKIAINSVYGMTWQKVSPFYDPKNIDNIVAKRGALFMIRLRNKLQNMGVTIVHCKTDSIKVENPTPEIEELIFAEGKKYGYTFEIEHKFEKLCLTDKASYVAKLSDDDPEHPGEWDFKAEPYIEPYIYKPLFKKEELLVEDLALKKTVQGAKMYIEYDSGDRKFVGRCGKFVPVLEGGGKLISVRPDAKKGGEKESAVTGTKGYKWEEASTIIDACSGNLIDMSYYYAAQAKVIDTINQYGNYYEFID